MSISLHAAPLNPGLCYNGAMENKPALFEYGDEAIAYLKRRDKALGKAIDVIGPIERNLDGDIFSSVVRHIIGQQISKAAQMTVWARFCALAGTVDAASVDGLSAEALQKCGMSFRKAACIKSFARKIIDGTFDMEAVYGLPDAELIKTFSALDGVGVWTAEMIMISCMGRMDVVSYGDLAIHRGMRMLYRHKKIDKKTFDRYARRYSPYGSVASLYLWAISGGAVPGLEDCAPKAKPRK